MKDINGIKLLSLNPQEVAAAVLVNISEPPEKPGDIFICVRKEGKKLFQKIYEGDEWRKMLEKAFTEIAQYEATSIEIGLSHNRRSGNNFDKMFGEVFKGIRGIALDAEGKREVFFPSQMIAENISFKLVAERFTEENAGKKITAEAFDVEQFILLIDEEIYLAPIYRGNQVVEFDEVTYDNTQELMQGMALWMANNVSKEGELSYKYWPSSGKYSESNNMIRQFMGTISLFQCAEFFNAEQIREKAELNLAYNIKNFYKFENGTGYIDERGKVKLGAVALAALAILHEGGDEFAEQEKLLFNLTKKLHCSDGSFYTFLKPAKTKEHSNFYPGECLLYWAYVLERKWSDALYGKFMEAFKYYQEWHRANRNPAFIPWHTQAYYKLYQLKKDQRLKDWIFEMNDWLLPFQQWDGLKAQDVRGRFYDPDKPYGPPHASATGVYIEGLIDAFKLAVEVGDEKRAEAYALVIKRGIRDIMQLQFSNELDMYYISKHERVYGGIRTTEYNNEIRVDNIQHNLMGIMKVLSDENFIW